jgi:Winged helix DNA-binding domain
MNDDKLRAWWFHRQGLDGSLAGSNAGGVLHSSGWARSVAGSGPYLTFFSRAEITRQAVDDAIAALAIHELPSARGCTYILSKEDFALGLSVAKQFSSGDLATARKLGVTDKEIQKLEAAVLKTLRGEPLLPDEIRKAVGSAARNLGPEGGRKGLTTTLPLALGSLQVSGQIRRIPVNGRLDQQRYRYALWRPNPFDGFGSSSADSYTELARRYFRWIGPATLSEFQWFSGLGVKASQAAVAPLQLVPVEAGCDRLVLPDDLSAFSNFKAPVKPQYALVSSLDAMFLLRRNIATLVPPAALQQKVYGEKGMSELGRLSDLSSNAILDRGSIVGLWEFDPEKSSLVWFTFAKPDRPLRDCIAKTEAFVRNQLGDARSFSLDSPKSRTPRIEAIRKLQPK